MPRVKPACVRRVSIGDSSGSCSEEEINHVLPEDPRERPDAHMCPRCQEQFENIHDFLYHKRVCDEKAMQMGEERMHSDPEEMVVSGDEEMDGPNKRLEQVRRHRQDAENNNSLEDGEAEVPEADVPPVGLPFPVAGHVTLEALQNTKVAVAQFAATAMANNADNEAALHELAVLQSTLFTLQHQQVFQLQLIRQLQNQLSLTRRKDEQRPSPPPNEPEPVVPAPPAPSPSPPRPPREPSPPVPTPPTSQNLPSTHSHLTPKTEPITIPKLPTSSPPMMSHPPYSSISSSLASSIITNNDPPPSLNEPNTLEMLQKRAQEVLDNASQGLLANNLADELAFRKSGKMSPYDGKSGGRNEPFFKHRCRYCGKVFGSDSALQIHIRSHTGERPFKCNVLCHRVLSCKSALQMHYRTHTGERPFRCKLCGRAFTTKGNLKTHMGVHRIKPPSQMLHQCPVCHKKFSDPTILHHHIRLHTSDRGNISFDQVRGIEVNYFPQFSHTSDASEFTPYRPILPSMFPTPSTPGDRRADSRGTDDESGRDEREPATREFDDDSDMKDRRTSPLSVCASASECEVKTITTTASLPSATGSESGRSARASPPSPSLSSLSTPPRLPQHSPLPSPPTPLAALGALGGSPFSPLGLAFPPAVRGNTTCNICYKTFACNSALEIHYRSHTKERPFKCTVCDRGFSTKGNMKQHMLTHKIRDMPPGFDKGGNGPMGPNEESREPSPDRRSSPDKMDLKRSPPAHPPPPMTHAPPIDMPPLPKRPTVPSTPTHQPPSASSKHLCGVCRKNFSSSSALQIHMRTHTGDKPFRCAVCQKAFTTKGNLKVHMGTHMWSGGASRRGRRMSLELPPRPLHEPHDLLRRPDLFYPYLHAPFLNGMQQKLNEISVIQQSAGQNGVAAKFPGLLGFGPFGAGRPGAASPLERPPSLEGGDERQAAMRELAERGRELAERSRQMREESEHYRSPPALAPHQPPSAQPSPPTPHHPLPHSLASLPPPARTEGLTV
ncbi:unnamed protein product [Parnassius mnemosyne]|uniref:C2H2-type domain-containing protein n=1 Tax=Parnassius mnemosyne TaxID=213953 RepID=A0AAV1M9F1_9NEOP